MLDQGLVPRECFLFRPQPSQTRSFAEARFRCLRGVGKVVDDRSKRRERSLRVLSSTPFVRSTEREQNLRSLRATQVCMLGPLQPGNSVRGPIELLQALGGTDFRFRGVGIPRAVLSDLQVRLKGGLVSLGVEKRLGIAKAWRGRSVRSPHYGNDSEEGGEQERFSRFHAPFCRDSPVTSPASPPTPPRTGSSRPSLSRCGCWRRRAASRRG